MKKNNKSKTLRKKLIQNCCSIFSKMCNLKKGSRCTVNPEDVPHSSRESLKQNFLEAVV